MRASQYEAPRFDAVSSAQCAVSLIDIEVQYTEPFQGTRVMKSVSGKSISGEAFREEALRRCSLKRARLSSKRLCLKRSSLAHLFPKRLFLKRSYPQTPLLNSFDTLVFNSTCLPQIEFTTSSRAFKSFLRPTRLRRSLQADAAPLRALPTTLFIRMSQKRDT